jgi:hypothetical protein
MRCFGMSPSAWLRVAFEPKAKTVAALYNPYVNWKLAGFCVMLTALAKGEFIG